MSGPESDAHRGLAVAVVGMAGRFPGAASVAEFWRKLCQGVECIARFSEDELQKAGVPPELFQNEAYVNASGIVAGYDLFDAAFFGYTPKEAEIIDPQQRIFLECAWATLEDAGYPPDGCPFPVGVFAGQAFSYYFLHNLYPQRRSGGLSNLQLFVSNDKDYVATRTAYKLNLRGPAVSVQTACSTSLVAVHLACQSLISGECDLALAGGVALRSIGGQGYLYSEGGIMSPDGHCRAFDARAGGTVGGDGVSLVALRRLEDALADGDTIHAVIRGSAVNNDGAGKIGFTAPSVDAQSECIAEALAVAGVEPESIGYVEAHGTGTPLGDPIEVAALTRAFGTTRTGYCALGSVKTNVGHMDCAAGVAGLIKAVLAVKHGVLPPSLHFETPNPNIDFAAGPFYVNTTLADWPERDGPRRAGVSSFGIGGTNAHVVVEQPPAAQKSGPSRPRHVFPLSARTLPALEELTAALAGRLTADPGLDPADVAYTLAVGRSHMEQRRVLVAGDLAQAAAALELVDPAHVATRRAATDDAPPTFALPGHGTVHSGCAAAIYREEPEFQRHVDHCCCLLGSDLGAGVQRVLVTQAEWGDDRSLQAEIPETGRATLFVLQYALARLWLSWGIRPQAVVGTGVGSLAAAVLDGGLSLEEALAQLSGGESDGVSEFVASSGDGACSHGGGTLGDFERLLSEPDLVVLEIGPRGSLAAALGREGLYEGERGVLTSLPSDTIGGDDEDHRHLLTTLGRLWLAGVDIDWRAFYGVGRRRRLPLPTYPFQRRRFWVNAPAAIPASGSAAGCGRPDLETAYVAPDSDLERTIARVWEEVLGFCGIGVHDDLFDLGGHSVIAAQVAARLRQVFPVDVPLRQVFETPTIAGLAEVIEELLIQKLSDIPDLDDDQT